MSGLKEKINKLSKAFASEYEGAVRRAHSLQEIKQWLFITHVCRT
jgi:hypothetical protein